MTAFLLAPDVAAQKPKPPRAKNVEVTVMRGGSVQIPLRGFERNLNRITYDIISSPRHGRLSNLTQYNGRDRQGPGEVTYTHGNDDDSTSDTFMFGVAATPGNLRGRGIVTIRVIDADPVLQITPTVLDFGNCAIGDPPARRFVELRNAGGGMIDGYLELPAPFYLEDGGSFVLRRGESTRLPILFIPEQRPGPYLFRVQPVPGDAAVLTLKGEALSPFFVEVADTRFALNPDKSRTARARVRNTSQQIQTINVVLPADLPVEPIAALDLEPGAEKEITLRIPPEKKAPVPAFDVRFEGEGHTQAQQFEAPAVPAELTIVATPDFGEVAPRSAAEANLVLRNDGGSSAEARLQEHESITPASGATAITLAPGQELTVPLKLKLKKDQALPAGLTITFQGSEIVVPVAASLLAQVSPTPTPTPSVTPPPAAQWALNEDVHYIAPPKGPAIAWKENPAYSGIVLQHADKDASAWQDYDTPAPQEGLLAWFWNLVRKIELFLNTEIKRPEVGQLGAEPSTTITKPIDPERAASDLWRLVASQDGAPARAVTSPFRIENDRLVADTGIAAATAVPQVTPVPTAQPAPSDRLSVRVFGPETSIASAGVQSERYGALLQVAFPAELGIESFRLEQGSMVSEFDPKTNIPKAPEFRKLDAPMGRVEILGVTGGELEAKKLTVCIARIDELPAGSRTYWRLVPSNAKGELPPSAVLLVDTLPSPPFPWNTVLLVALFLLLAAVLWLRWRINRAPR